MLIDQAPSLDMLQMRPGHSFSARAGGLHAGNVAEALRAVTPFGVDVCSMVRTDGRMDPAKLAAFIGQAWAAER